MGMASEDTVTTCGGREGVFVASAINTEGANARKKSIHLDDIGGFYHALTLRKGCGSYDTSLQMRGRLGGG
jgi:hypothetical protein